MVANDPASPQTYSRSIGIEIADSATRFTAICGDEPSHRRWQTRLAAPPSPEEAVSHLHELIERVVRDTPEKDSSAPEVPSLASPIAAIGVALWGRVDASHGIVHELRPLADWQDFPLAKALHERWRIPVTVASAVAVAALAEAQQSANVQSETLLYIHLGRTISAACIRNGSISLGERDSEGMLAHMVVSLDGPRCSCGLPGHLEPIASAQAIVRTMIGLASDSEKSTAAMLRISHGRAEAMSAIQVMQLATEGEPIAARVIENALDALALALANTVAVLAPDAIIIGGQLTEAGDGILTPLSRRLASLCSPFVTPPALRLGTLEPYAALRGAQLLAHTWHNT